MDCRALGFQATLSGRRFCRRNLPAVRSGGVMRQIRNFMQHFFNPLHVYCRLKDMGVKTPTAHKMSKAYERYLWRFIW
jgi:hypothetical protein